MYLYSAPIVQYLLVLHFARQNARPIAPVHSDQPALFICAYRNWVPAHVGLGSNEHADYLAGLGSAASATGQVNIDRLRAIQTRNFLPAPD